MRRLHRLRVRRKVPKQPNGARVSTAARTAGAIRATA